MGIVLKLQLAVNNLSVWTGLTSCQNEKNILRDVENPFLWRRHPDKGDDRF